MKQFISDKPDQENDSPLSPPDLREEISALREMLDQTRTEVMRLRRRIDRLQLESDSHSRRTLLALGVTILVVAGLITVVWYGLIRKDDLTSRIPAFFGQHGTERAEPKPQSPVVDESRTNLPITSSASAVSPSTYEPTGDIRSGGTADLPKETTGTKPGFGVPVEPTRGHPNSADRSADAKQPRVLKNTPSATSLSDSVKRTRIEFEVPLNRTEETAPGIFLTVRSTNVQNQQLEGWVQIAEEGRTIWLRGQASQTLVTFTTKRDSRSRGLMFTRIDARGVAGYLLIPTSSS